MANFGVGFPSGVVLGAGRTDYGASEDLEQKEILLQQGFRFERVGGKHCFVLFSGDRRTNRLLKKTLKWKESAASTAQQ